MPTELRVVFAASATAATASETNAASARLLASARTRLETSGIPATDIDHDFIAMVPVYTWGVTRQGDRDVVAEKRSGYRLQHNLHVRVRDEASAAAVITAAHEVEGIEVLAIDYWSNQLEQKQVEARDKALAAVRQKAKALLTVFAEAPVPINVHETTHVMFPQQLYQALPRTEDNSGGYFDGQLPRVPASRPSYVYYRGLFADVDAVETAMPGRREIHIVSTALLYFEAPHRPRPVDGK